MTVLWLYLVVAGVFLALDAAWLKWGAGPLFHRVLGDMLRSRPKLGVAAGFYLLYAAGVVYFAAWPAVQAGAAGLALVNGAILGFLAYGTYEATNMATLNRWRWSLVVSDLAWGTLVSGLAAWAAAALVLAAAG